MAASLSQVMMLERRLAQLESELAGMRRHASRAGLFTRVLACCTLVALGGALTLGTASAGPAPGALTAKAPFRVVDGSGKVLLFVNSSGVFFKRDGATQAAFGATADGGAVCTYSAAGKSNGCLSSIANGGSQLQVGLPGDSHIQIGGGVSGNMGLRAYKGQKELAFFGAVAAGGEASFYKTDGANPSTIVGAGPAGGYLQIQDQKATPLAVVAEHNGGGFFTLANSQGITRVQAIVTTEDAGLVRVYGPTKFDFLTGS